MILDLPERTYLFLDKSLSDTFGCEARLISGPLAKSSSFYLSIYEEIKIFFSYFR